MKYYFFIFILLFSFNSVQSQHWQEAYNKAVSAYESGDYGQAYEDSKEALKIAYERHGEYSNESINTLQLLINVSEDHPEENLNYSKGLVETIDKAVGKENKYYLQACKNHQTLLINNEKYKEGIKFSEKNEDVFKALLEITDPYYGLYCSDLAFLYYQLQDNEKAINYYNKSIIAFKTNEEYFENLLYDLQSLSKLLIKNNDHASVITNGRSIENLVSRLEINPKEEAVNYADLGNAYKELENYDSATYYLFKAKQIFEGQQLQNESIYSTVVNHLAFINDRSGNINKSQELLLQGSAGQDKVTLFNQAISAQNSGDNEQAESYYKKLFVLNNSNELDDAEKIKLFNNYSLLKLNSGEFKEAKENNEVAIKFAGKHYGKRSIDYFKIIYRKGLILNSLGEAGQAIDVFKELTRDLEKNDFSLTPVYVDAISYYSILQQSVNNFSESLILLEKAVEIASQINMRKDDLASLYNNYAVILQLNGNYEKAENFQLKSLLLTGENIGIESSGYANGLLNLGEIYVKKGEFFKADSTYQKSKNILEQMYGAKSPSYALALMSTTKLYKEQGKYVEADKAYLEAMEIFKAAGGNYYVDYAYALNDYALLLQVFGNYRLAERYFNEAADIFSKAFGETNPDYISALSNLSTLYQIQDKHEKAERILKKVLAIDKKVFGENHPKYATTLHNLASILQKQKKHKDAVIYYEQALRIDSMIYGTNHYSYANTLYNLADIYDVQEEYKKAFVTYQKVLIIMREHYGEDNPEYIYRLFGLAKLYQRQHNYEKALQLYDQIIKHYLFQIQEYFPALSEDQQALFYAKVNPVFNAYRELLINSSDPKAGEKLFELQLKTKALLLNASNKLKLEISRTNDPVVKKLYEELSTKKASILNYYSLSKEELEKQNINLHELEVTLNNIEKELSQRVQLFSEVFEVEDYTWKDVQEQLKENEVVVEIVRVEESLKDNKVTYAATVLSATGLPQMTLLPDGEFLEERAYKLYRNSIKYDFADNSSYSSYWEPIASLIKNAEIIYLCPDGIYNKINLNTIYNTNSDSYFIDNYNIKYLSSTKEILRDEIANEKPELSASMFGYPLFKTEEVNLTASISENSIYQDWMLDIDELPGTRTEITGILDELEGYHWKTSGYLAGTALESNLKNLKSPRVLHIATHGFFSADISYEVNDWKEKDNTEEYDFNPLLRSGIFLTSAESSVRKRINGMAVDAENDGILTAYEAMSLSLDQTDLVILSACETGLGEIKNGEGVYGLQRAFLVSGAKNIIMSLWKVDDEVTQELMTTFYSLWLESNDLHNSFRDAQLKIKEKHKKPYLWGGFIINGK